MQISKVKNAIKVADALLNHEDKLRFIWLSSASKEMLKDSSGRVYIFVIDGIIKKIGGSQAKGGIKSTMGNYSGGDIGDPGESRFVANYEIKEALRKGQKIEVFLITSTKVRASVKGLFDSEMSDVAPFQEMESRCKNDYRSEIKRFPDWNYKENNERYPDHIKKAYVVYKNSRTSKKKK
jgi:hypothetical protein